MKCKSKLVFHGMHYQCYPHNVGVVLCILRAANYKILRLFVHLWNMLMHSSIHPSIYSSIIWTSEAIVSCCRLSSVSDMRVRFEYIENLNSFEYRSLYCTQTLTFACNNRRLIKTLQTRLIDFVLNINKMIKFFVDGICEVSIENLCTNAWHFVMGGQRLAYARLLHKVCTNSAR